MGGGTGEDLLEVLAVAQGRGLLGPGPVERHLEHAAAFRAFVPDDVLVADLGTGGGPPGLILAVFLPGTRWVFIEAQRRRADFLRWACARLGLSERVAVREERAETVGRDGSLREACGVVVARAFGSPAVTAECAAPLLVPTGVAVVSEPPGGAEARWPGDGLALLGLAVQERHTGPPALVVLAKIAPCPDRYPRGVGRPAKRPLW
ncbi:MAG: class I SAM-dependent methyltransferase [Acidimicrobiales bacterium]|nr:class I SAM-dependent methyltransferase [Acidimicrobiales bacterium]